jgi:hypothetical protein
MMIMLALHLSPPQSQQTPTGGGGGWWNSIGKGAGLVDWGNAQLIMGCWGMGWVHWSNLTWQ